ncbi:MAG TPA: 2-amino-4-hydroxy-6-hydroxymethyldihydropteridine diphosphokinase [Calditrichaeota bacterium]|nr:2-amino-4-hydroxy-6-hydroxymethyldihydropteridine diphosphokinase [Calditrichota bacterium]
MIYYLSLGSNLGDRRQSLQRALDCLVRLGRLVRLSAVYESEPVGMENQPLFLNMLCILQSDLHPHRFLRKLKAFEVELGRRFASKWGPRIIDIDIVEYDGEVVASSILQIPHKEWERRNFVLIPFKALVPQFVTRTGKPIQLLVEKSPDKSRVNIIFERIY